MVRSMQLALDKDVIEVLLESLEEGQMATLSPYFACLLHDLVPDTGPYLASVISVLFHLSPLLPFSCMVDFKGRYVIIPDRSAHD